MLDEDDAVSASSLVLIPIAMPRTFVRTSW
jgi:hypothetical protein